METVNLEGQFTYRDGKWRQKITPGRAMRNRLPKGLPKLPTDVYRQIQSRLDELASQSFN
ncbi:MAG: hypothetical protein P8X95_28790 [Anaerolineales bacterium]